MRITKVLSKIYPTNTFYREGMDISVCSKFTKMLNNEVIPNILSVEVKLSSKNPKKKGFKKILFRDIYSILIDGKSFTTLHSHEVILNKLGIKVGDYFWMKATPIV